MLNLNRIKMVFKIIIYAGLVLGIFLTSPLHANEINTGIDTAILDETHSLSQQTLQGIDCHLKDFRERKNIQIRILVIRTPFDETDTQAKAKLMIKEVEARTRASVVLLLLNPESGESKVLLGHNIFENKMIKTGIARLQKTLFISLKKGQTQQAAWEGAVALMTLFDDLKYS